jgi:hypothetical protein
MFGKPIPYYHRFSQTGLFGFIFHTIVDKADKRMLNDSRENETKKPVVIWD